MEKKRWETMDSHRYKGNKFDYFNYITSNLWKRRKAIILKRDCYRCRVCGRRDFLHVHHLSYDLFTSELDCQLISLCPDCHKLVHYFADKAEYILKSGQLYPESEVSGIPLANALFQISSEMRDKIGRFTSEYFIPVLLLTMLGEPFGDESRRGELKPLHIDIEAVFEDALMCLKNCFSIEYYKTDKKGLQSMKKKNPQKRLKHPYGEILKK